MQAPRRLLLLLVLSAAAVAACGTSGGKPGAADSAAAADTSSVAGAKVERTSDIVRLAARMKQGDAFAYAITSFQDVSMSRDSSVEKSRQRMVYRYRFDVLEAKEDGSSRLRVTCLGMLFKGEYTSNGESKTMQYDSEEKNDPAKEKQFAQYNAPVNTPFEILLSKEGRIESVSKYDDVIRRLLGKDFNTIKQDARQKIAADFAERGLKELLQTAFQKLEDRPIGVDSAWHHLWAGDLGFLKIKNDATYTLKGFTQGQYGKLAHIAAVMTSRYIGSSKLDTGQGMATVEQFDVNGSGSTVFDIAQGRPDSRKLTQTIKVRFFIEPPDELKQAAPDQAKNFRITQNATVQSTIEKIAL